MCRGEGCDEVRVRGYAADALADLAYENEPNRVRIAAEGGVGPLVELLKSDDASLETKGDAAKALANLAHLNAPNQSAIGAEGGVEALVETLRVVIGEGSGADDDAIALRRNVSEALASLALRNEANQIRIAESGGACDLIKLLESACAQSSSNAAAALEALTVAIQVDGDPWHSQEASKLDPKLLEAIASALRRHRLAIGSCCVEMGRVDKAAEDGKPHIGLMKSE